MPRAKRICGQPGCPKVVAKRYCTQHDAEYEAKRGTPAQRGYGQAHRNERTRWASRIERGIIDCARCQQPILPGSQWALDHDDRDRTKYLGPSHKYCNDSAGGKNAHTN